MRFKQTFTGLLCGLGSLSFAQVTELQDLSYFVGSGSDTAGVVIDFLDSTQQSAFAWGVLFNDSIDGQGVVNALSQDPALSFDVANGFLNDVLYSTHNLSGIGGSPNYWGTWSGSPGSWVSNLGLSTPVTAGSWFGFSYMDFNPAIEPGLAIAAQSSVSLGENRAVKIRLYPVPFQDKLTIELSEVADINIYNVQGVLMSEASRAKTYSWNAVAWPSGVYIVVVHWAQGGHQAYKVIK